MFWKNPRFTVKRKAKRHKSRFEKVHVYSYPYEVKGRHYYLADYLRMGRTAGHAVFSDEQDNAEDALSALNQLIYFYRLSERVQDEGTMRAKIDLKLLQHPIEVMEKQWDDRLRPGYELLDRLLRYQLKYRKIYDEMMVSLRELREAYPALGERDLSVLEEGAAELEALQLEMLHNLTAEADKIKTWIESMKALGLWEELNTPQQVFYRQLLENQAAVKDEIQGVKDESAVQLRRSQLKKLKKELEGQKKEARNILRYP
ncbi:hypothetical protein [Salisediminibacterium halotolerans]|uniref:Uncharacterized protein n=1 Tax=Salisediminibacterium halotolerans TaxID=517425 RepID=A0A1H9VYG9_9BACI|nr:hypothetical protein [Salisediminibacterium haloalkalitolerans]SES26437.1 hypothetical protein SAMN05444126_12510 [Salisediminibacterium haloalkalitolerans]